MNDKKNSILNKPILASIVLYIVILILVEFGIYFFLDHVFRKNIKTDLDKRINELIYNINGITDENKDFAFLFFNEAINRQEFKSILQKRKTGISGNETTINESYNQILPYYNIFKDKGFSILKIYTSEGKLILDMKNNGKSFSNDEVSESVSMVLQDKVFVYNIELENNMMAIKFVFPIYFKNSFIGAVEIGKPLNCFINDFKYLNFDEISVIIKKNLIDGSVESDKLLKNGYLNSVFEDYYELKGYDDTIKCFKTNIDSINRNTKNIINNEILASNFHQIEMGERFNCLSEDAKFPTIVSFYPLKNNRGDLLSYLIFYQKNTFSTSSLSLLKELFFLTSLFLILITGLIYFLLKRNNTTLQQQSLIKAQTDELQKVNAKLIANQEAVMLQNEELASQTDELESKKELLTAVNKELEKMSIIASETNNLIYVFNEKGELDWFNEAFYKKIGYNLSEYKELFGKTIIELSRSENIYEYYQKCIQTKQSVSYESSMKSKSGENFWFHTTLTPIFNNDNLSMIIAIDSDVTELKSTEEELAKQHRLTIKQKDEIVFQKKELTDSIIYAKRIQEAILPKADQLKKHLPDSFVIYKPKDIVSGDFLWYFRKENSHLLITVDCTGHGVPGAFMSIIGTYLLNNIIIQNKIFDPAEILKNLNRKLKISLKTTNPEQQTHDGMDVAICKFNLDTSELVFAGAVRPLFLFSKNKFNEVKGDKNPITSYIANQTKNVFSNRYLRFEKGDVLYMFSDGIIDQFGGNEDKKFLSKRLKQLLLDINMLSMEEQRKIIHRTFNAWKGANEQVDDVLIIGVRNT